MPPSISLKEKEERVDQLIAALELTGSKDSYIGGASFLRGISGGEMKRVSIGIELVTDPDIIFLDGILLVLP